MCGGPSAMTKSIYWRVYDTMCNGNGTLWQKSNNDVTTVIAVASHGLHMLEDENSNEEQIKGKRQSHRRPQEWQ